MPSGGKAAAGDPLRELRDGIDYWHSRTSWAADLHNADYEEWSRQDPQGSFTIEWWERYQLPRLRQWIATRPVSSAVLTERYRSSMNALEKAWRQACLPHLGQDITAVSWEEIRAFPDEVATVKPMRDLPSAVFTSKFCHFLLPRIFPVVDEAALGASGRAYGSYFQNVQEEWSGTDGATRDALVAELVRAVEAHGSPVFSGFPVVNKVVELRRIGRRHPGETRAFLQSQPS